jgi:hypothetical protein
VYDRNLVEKIRDRLWVMGNVEDLLFECHFMDFLKPKKILELGAAAGSWGLLLHYFGSGEVQFDFVENFDYARRNFDQGQPWPWPSNKQELEMHVSSLALEFNKPFNFNVIDMDAKDCTTLNLSSYDIIRWDCEFKNYKNIIKTIATLIKPSSVIFVDDTAINKCSHRLITMMNLVNDGIVCPLWFGNNQSAWVKPIFPRNLLFNYMKDKQDNFLDYREKTGWPYSENGTQWAHCSTSSYDFRKNFRIN